MANPNDLLDPLRFKSLGEYTLEDIRTIGGGVFTMVDTLEHLELLDKIAKAYRSVHLPTYGQLLAGSNDPLSLTDATNNPNFWEGADVSSATNVTLTALEPNQVRRYQQIDCSSTESGTTLTVIITNPNYGKGTVIASKEITTSSIAQPLLDEPIEISYPQVLTLSFSSSGTVASRYSATSCLTQQ